MAPGDDHDDDDTTEYTTQADDEHDVEEIATVDAEQPLLQRRTTTTTTRRRRRLLDRDADFSQSRGRWNIRHTAGRSGRRQRNCCARKVWDHWFYYVSYSKTPVLISILFVAYTTLVVLYASIYLGISRLGSTTIDDSTGRPDQNTANEEEAENGKTTMFCYMGIPTFMEALYFSLSTMTTIGYGVGDYYFGSCWTPLVVVLLQVCTALTFDAVSVALLYQRCSRGHKRRKTMMISDDCVVARVRGTLHCMFRIAEMRRHALLNTSVRAFCVYHDRRMMVMIGDNDNSNHNGTMVETTHFVTRPVRLQHQQIHDNVLMSLPQVMCHVMDDTSPLRPVGDSWLDVRGHAHSIGPVDDFVADVETVRAYWQDRAMEMIVIVQGMDELTGASIEARHSYTCDNVAWNRLFTPCMDANATVDFARFHETQPAALNYPNGHAHVL